MRRAFTLIELLVIITIIGLMVTVAVVNVRSGQDSARVKGAARDIFALMRRARSTALLTQKPAVVDYSCERGEDGEVVAKVEISSAKVTSSEKSRAKVQTLSGEPLSVGDDEASAESTMDATDEAQANESSTRPEGTTVEEFLFEQIPTDVFKGIRIKVLRGDEELEGVVETAPSKPKISVFSNVDYLLGKYQSEKKAAAEKKAAESEAKGDASPSSEELQQPEQFLWETNGRVEPHRVWVYADGFQPEDGFMIKVDRFGGMKIYGRGEEE